MQRDFILLAKEGLCITHIQDDELRIKKIRILMRLLLQLYYPFTIESAVLTLRTIMLGLRVFQHLIRFDDTLIRVVINLCAIPRNSLHPIKQRKASLILKDEVGSLLISTSGLLLLLLLLLILSFLQLHIVYGLQ